MGRWQRVCQRPPSTRPSARHQAPALLTALRTLTVLCGVRHVLLADAVLVRLAVSARAGADPGLEAAAAENLTAGGRQCRRRQGEKQSGREEVKEECV